jgi:glycosyltransferase involved in cell wall biosynthesis
MAGMAADSPARLLDVTRLASRVGRGPLTGVDRVERAYLTWFMSGDVPLFLLLRTAFGYLILPREAGGMIAALLEDAGRLPRAGLMARMGQRATPRVLAEAALRQSAVGRVWRGGLTRAVARCLPKGGEYFNVGHSNLSDRTLGQLARVPGLRMSVLIHDTIPLDFPQFSAAGASEAFRAKLGAAARHATRLICPSAVAAADVARWCGPVALPPVSVAHLGIEPAEPDVGALPADLMPGCPYFVVLGTVEPRKNHALLLDVWDCLRAMLPDGDVPVLIIAGRRGWNNDAVFRRLDALRGGPVREVPGLPDGAVAALVQGACGLLMPSFAEGFGLPVAEAISLGTPVIAADLPVYREIFGNSPVYVNPNDQYQWATKIQELVVASGKRATGGAEAVGLTWQNHFNAVMNTIR